MTLYTRVLNFLQLLDHIGIRSKHEFSEPIEIGGEEYNRGPFRFYASRRRVRICKNCGITDAVAALKPWCCKKVTTE